MTKCIFCQHETDAMFFCDECGKILPVAAQNYLELFGIQNPAHVDIADLNKRLFQLQSKLHPDNFVGDSIEEIAMAIAHSSKINQAYEVLKNPVKRLEYVLSMLNLSLESDDAYNLPQEFAMQAFELQEELESLVSEEKKEEFKDKIYRQIKLLTQDGFDALARADSANAFKIFAKIKYLKSITQQ